MPRHFAILLAFVALASSAPSQDRPDQLFRDAQSSLAAKKYTEAEAAFRRLYAAEPGNIRGLVGVVQVYMAQGKRDDALRLLDEENAKPPVRPDLLAAAGDTAMEAEYYGQAIARYRQALASREDKGPDTAPEGAASLYTRLSQAWHKKGDDKSALDAARHAREILPNDPDVLWNLGNLLDSAGRKKEALETYRKVMEINPGNVLALNNAAYLMTETGGDLYEALRYAQRADLLQPGVSQVTDTVGWVKLKLGWIDDALATFVGLVVNEPDNLEYRAHLAAAIEKSGDHSPKLRDLMAVLKKAPGPENTAQIIEMLKSDKK